MLVGHAVGDRRDTLRRHAADLGADGQHSRGGGADHGGGGPRVIPIIRMRWWWRWRWRWRHRVGMRSRWRPRVGLRRGARIKMRWRTGVRGRLRVRRHGPWRGHRVRRWRVIAATAAMGHYKGPRTATATQLPGLGGQRYEQCQQQAGREYLCAGLHGCSPCGSNCCKGTERAPAGGVNSKSCATGAGLSCHW